MPKQLWFRLLVGTSVMLVLALGTAGFVLHQFAVSSFEDYVDDVNAVRGQRVEALLSRYYSRRNSWTGVDPLVQQIADLVGQPILLADSDDVVIVDSQHRFVGQRVSDRWRQEIVPIRSGDMAVGTLYIDPLIPRERFGQRGDAFLAELTTSLLSATGVGLLAALALSLLLARRLARPLEMLTGAARRLEAGERPTALETSMGGEVGQLAEAFNSLAASLARVEKLRQNMVNDIAHELRTPLTTVRGYIEALQDGVTEPTPEVLNTVHTELLQLTRLVDDLRDLALAEARQLRLAPEPVDVDELITHDVRASAVAADLQHVRIETKIDSALPRLTVDRGRFSQVLRNILNNALTHTPAEGVITVRARPDRDGIVVEVQDSGSGIAADDLPHVFERFYRGDRSRSRRAGGAGLGLTIARELVAAHGGHLSVESQPNDGARFIIHLPITPPHAASMEREQAVAPQPAPHSAGRLTGLLRLAFYGLTTGALAGMVGGLGESLMVSLTSRRPIDTMSIAPYAMLIDAMVVGLACGGLALLIGLVLRLRGQIAGFRRIATFVGPLAVMAIGTVLTLKWTQLTFRDAPTATVIGVQLLIAFGSMFGAALCFAALSTASRWREAPVMIGRRLVPGLTLVIATIAVIGVLRDLTDRGVNMPLPWPRTLREMIPAPLPVGIDSLADRGGDRPSSGAAALIGTATRPNIVLVTVDALRADHIGAYGYESAFTPTLDQLATEGWRFDLAISPLAGSSPAHASLFTGAAPSRHGIRSNMVDTLSHDVPTLAEVLRGDGYTTAGLFSWFNFEPAYSGLDRGFQTYEDYTINLPQYLADSNTQALAATYRRLKSYLAIPAAADLDRLTTEPSEDQLDGKADVTTTAAVSWLERRRQEPFLLWVHYLDPHAPYTPPTLSRRDSPCPTCPNGTMENIRRLSSAGVEPSAPEINSVVRAYDSEVAFVDRNLGRLLDQLNRLDLASNTLVVIVGAYGQSFGDHGAWLEGDSVYNAEIQVPLIMRMPGVIPAGQLVPGPVSLTDVFPTILDIVGLSAPPGLDGQSVLESTRGRTPQERVVIAESADRSQLAVVTAEWKLIRRDDGRVELYYIPTDPDEQFERSATDPQVVQHLLRLVEDGALGS